MACSRNGSSGGGGGPDRADAAGNRGDSPGADAQATDPSGEAGSDAGPRGALFAFVGSGDGKIRSYVVDEETGAWTFKTESSAGQDPSFLAFDPSHRRVVAVDEGAGMVRSFAFDPTTGALAELSSKPAGGAGSTHLSIDPSGTWVTVANYTGGNMSIFPIDEAGTLGDASDTKPSGDKSHWAGSNPSGTHVFVPALGKDVVAQYTLSSTTGKLTDNGAAPLPAGAGPRHLTFHPSEAWAYTINELANTVTTFTFDKSSGKLTAKQTLSALPPGQSTEGVTSAAIALHPSGKHLYASTRGYNAIAHFTVDASDGTLTYVASAGTGADQPRSFAMAPDGTLLYAGNQSADHVVGFRVSPASGALTPLGKTVDVTRPTYVGLARMP
jgi:6-phosphogluconolactonase